ncbi:hypothetical protein QFC19_001140 [Naganishia cerealis]|uniref:Uncharacterized protein n=1 Tax=Naganishia cerealis TaxID=610337 RepID=A0ACC2WJX4_9TREE|nr:hypothetical protein QFC19_001140 [Naganishia cerealis]
MSDSKRLEQGQASGDTARDSDTRPTLEESTDRSTLILESPYAGVTTFNTSLPEPPLPTLQSATTLPVDTRNLLPLSIPGTPGMGASPSISRTASPAINPSPNASYHDSPRGSTSLDHDSDRAQRDRNGYGMAVTMTDATGSEFETEDDEVQTKTSLSVRMPWSRNTYSGHNASANPNSSWPWRTRRPTVDLLHSHNPTDHKHGHTRATSNEYSPLKKHGSNPSLADRHDSLATVSSSMHSSSSYGNPPSENAQSTTYSQYSDYSSMPDGLGDTPSSKDQLNPAIAAFSSELGKHRRGLRQALGWIKRRIGVGASGVVELASEASQRVAGTTGGTIRLPSGSLGSRRRRKKRKTVKGAVHDTSWLFNIVQLIPTQPWTIVRSAALIDISERKLISPVVR